jgi:VIT1/CCC1 family predicted Fe2+/Mn2+ transporter
VTLPLERTLAYLRERAAARLPPMASPSSSPALHRDVTRALQVVNAYQRRPLEPVERFSEIIFGLIMVLTFTGAVSVAAEGQEPVKEVLAAALTCNVAWGLIDGVMFVLTSVIGRARRAFVIHGIRAADPATARTLVKGALPEGVASITNDAEADGMVARLRALPEPRRRFFITVADLRGAIGSCLLVVLATFPPTVPFMLVDDAARAIRISNAVAVVSLFLAGFYLGRATGLPAWRLGLVMVVLGVSLVGITIALGG